MMIQSVFQNMSDKSRARLLLYAALLTGICIVLAHLVFYPGIDYRDSANVYTCMARSLAEGDYAAAFHPGIPPLNVLCSRVFTVFGMPPDLAMSAVSCLFYLATIPFLYLFLKCFVPDCLSAFGAILFACAPKIIRFSCTGLIDSGKIFFLVAGLYFSCRMARSKYRSYGVAVGFGAALGGLSLARSEGVANACVLFGCTALFWLWSLWREKRFPPVLPLVTTLAAWALVLGGRVLINWHFCGRPVFDERIHAKLLSVLGAQPAAAAATAEEIANASVPAESNLEFWIELLRKNIVGNYEVYFGFAVAGVVLMILAARGGKWRILWPDRNVPEFVKWDPFFIVPVLSVAFNILIFRITQLHAYRYFLLNIPLFMVFTLITCWWIWRWAVKLLPRPLLGVGIAAIVVILAFQIDNGVDNFFSKSTRATVRSGRVAGDAMRAEDPDGRVFFWYACIEWYYSGLKRALPIETPQPDTRTFSDFDFFLVRKDEDTILANVEDRSDLREIPLPPESTVRLFRKLEEN